MLSNYLKRVAQNAMLSAAPGAVQSEMNQAEAEDLDFIGLPAEGQSAAARVGAVLAAMTLEEKLEFVTGYKSLGIRALPRHGLPSVWMTDATSGPRSYGPTTAFPSAVAMAATWDTALVAEAADHIAEATRAKGASILLGPGINIARIPTCGRNFEYMGEDPFLAGKLASAYIKACTQRGVICTVKHLAANNSEYDRHKISSDMDERTLREIYLPAFEAAVVEGQTLGLMSGYNPVNGVWASENKKLLTEILRDEWGFDGLVVSDWNSLYSTHGPMKSGLDIEMPKAKWFRPGRVKAAFSTGNSDIADLDKMVGNLLRTLFLAGVYDRPVKDPEAREFHTDHDAAALKTARAAVVLLKNEDSTLPLPQGPGTTIAVCGPLALQSAIMGGGSCHVSRTTGTVNLKEGMDSAADEGTRIVTVTPDDHKAIAEADAVVIACGFDHKAESELYDRPWRLPRRQRKLINHVIRLNPRCVVTLTSGGGVETESWISAVPALIHGLYLGQTVGTATAEILFGKVNP
jgi:beta-glucosidase